MSRNRARWYQYSLRTLFIFVTLLAIPCGYLGEQYRIVKHRKAVREKFKEVWFLTPRTAAPGPLIRQWLGDEPVGTAFVYEGMPQSDREEIASAFPEAAVDTLKLQKFFNLTH